VPRDAGDNLGLRQAGEFRAEVDEGGRPRLGPVRWRPVRPAERCRRRSPRDVIRALVSAFLDRARDRCPRHHKNAEGCKDADSDLAVARKKEDPAHDNNDALEG
jgi:hypothetical protein